MGKKDLAKREQHFLTELGIANSPAPVDPVATMQQEEESATLFDRLTPAELTDLYLNDRERWKEIMRAKKQSGLRRLFGGGH